MSYRVSVAELVRVTKGVYTPALMGAFKQEALLFVMPARSESEGTNAKEKGSKGASRLRRRITVVIIACSGILEESVVLHDDRHSNPITFEVDCFDKDMFLHMQHDTMVA